MLPFTLLIPSIVLGFLVLRRSRQYVENLSYLWSNEVRPPRVIDWLPFVGNAFGMGSGDQFWRDAEKKYGPAFRLLAMGDERTFITSPALVHWVYRKSKAFKMIEFRKFAQHHTFGMDKGACYSEAMEFDLLPSHHRAMQSSGVQETMHRYGDILLDYLPKRVAEAENEGEEVDLVDFAFDVMYYSSSQAWFSPAFPSASMKKPFLAFDKVFPLLNLESMPSIAMKAARQSRDDMIQSLTAWWSTTTDDDRRLMNPSITVQWEIVVAQAWGVENFATCLLAEFWALEANAPFVGIWATAQVARRPSLQATLRDEVELAISKLSPPTISSLLHLSNQDLVEALPRMQALFQETLRFHTASSSIRYVMEDITLPAHLCGDGIGAKQGLHLRIGDQVIGVTRANHVDPTGEWGKDADRFDPERFLNNEAAETRPVYIPFGGGQSMCTGRHFASTEILTFLAMFVYLCDVSSVSDALEPNFQRIGLGAMQPGKGKMKVRIAKRNKA